MGFCQSVAHEPVFTRSIDEAKHAKDLELLGDDRLLRTDPGGQGVHVQIVIAENRDDSEPQRVCDAPQNFRECLGTPSSNIGLGHGYMNITI
jgi:hypothetical protein